MNKTEDEGSWELPPKSPYDVIDELKRLYNLIGAAWSPHGARWTYALNKAIEELEDKNSVND